MLFSVYPYHNFSDYNLDYILKIIKKLSLDMAEFININTIKYANPIAWNITKQYEANTVVIDPVDGTAYISVKPVPSGVHITNDEYWTPIFNYGDSIENLEKQICPNYEKDTLTATYDHKAGDLFWYNHTLCVNKIPFIEGTAFVENVNYEKITIEEILNEKLNVVDTCSNMKTYNFKKGDYVQTLGYYSVSDGGGTFYKITDVEPSYYHETLNNGLYCEMIYSDFLTPQMFGAVCDGETNDASPFQRAVSHAHYYNIPLKITRSLLIDGTISVPSQVRIEGYQNNDVSPFVYIGDNVSVLFNFTAVRNVLKNFGVAGKGLIYRNGATAFVFNGSANHDVDVIIENVSFAYIDRAIDGYGRNIHVNNCSFSHCRIGISYRTSASQLRGLQVENSRFHGIGEEAALNWFENSEAIYVMHNSLSNLTIRNNVFDQGGTAIYGYASNMLIENNFFESFKASPIKLGFAQTSITPANYGAINIFGNLVRGKQGAVAADVSVAFPDHLIEIENLSRISIIGNSFASCNKEAIKINSASRVKVSNNSFLGLCQDGVTTEAALNVNNCECLFTDNANFNPQTINYITEGANYSRLYIKDNQHFNTQTFTNTVLEATKHWRTIGTFAANNEVNLNNFPEQFIAVLADGTTFDVVRNGNNFNTSIGWDTNNTFFVLKWVVDDTQSPVTVTPVLRKYDVLNWSAGAAYSYSFTCYEMVDY